MAERGIGRKGRKEAEREERERGGGREGDRQTDWQTVTDREWRLG